MLKSLAEDFSSISSLSFSYHDNVCSFELGKYTSMVLEMEKENTFFISVCFKCEDEREQKKILVKALKLFHPLRSSLFFCKVFLLNGYVVVSINEMASQLSAGRLYQFSKHVIKTLIKAGASEI